MKPVFFFGLLLVAAQTLCAQTKVQSFALNGAKGVVIEGSLSSIEITTSTSGEVSLQHKITVNDELRPDLGKITVDRSNGKLILREESPTIKSLKKEFPDGWNSYRINDEGERTQMGPRMETKIILAVPANVKVEAENLYGGVKATDVAGLSRVEVTYGPVEVILSRGAQLSDLSLESTYGPVDVSLPGNSNANLLLRTNYGELFTDFDLKVNTDRSENGNFKEKVVATIGRGGPEVVCKAPYGNVYLRMLD